jgi:tetratricopeptide (TPR) repeat protein
MKYTLSIAALILFIGTSAYAETRSTEESALMLQGAVKTMKRDFHAAEDIYSRIISMDNNNAEAYVQRGLVRRELKNTQGMEADANRAIVLIDAGLQQNPNDADLYYHRSTAERMLKNFDAAEQDLNQSIHLGKHGNFDTDWKAIALERKMAQ